MFYLITQFLHQRIRPYSLCLLTILFKYTTYYFITIIMIYNIHILQVIFCLYSHQCYFSLTISILFTLSKLMIFFQPYNKLHYIINYSFNMKAQNTFFTKNNHNLLYYIYLHITRVYFLNLCQTILFFSITYIFSLISQVSFIFYNYFQVFYFLISYFSPLD